MELISSIIGRSQAAVSDIVGSPNSAELLTTHKYPNSIKCCYRQGEIEIIYIKQVADWIIVKHTNTFIIHEFIHLMGLELMKPVYDFEYSPKLRTCLTYKDIEGIKEITIYITLQKVIDYLSIKAFSL